MDDVVEVRRGRAKGAALVGAGLVAGMVLAGLTTADAQTAPAPPAARQADDHGKDGKREGGRHGIGKVGRGVLHGEAVVRAPGGGYRTVAMQRGVVTALSATSVAVRNEDGFARTYARDARTRVADGVAVGDAVVVVAEVANGDARALHVREARGRDGKRGKG